MAVYLPTLPCPPARSSLRRLGRLGPLGLGWLLTLISACEEPATSPTQPDGGSDADLASPAAEVKPKVVPVSATGHDRFYGVAFDAQGSFYATGVVADGTDAATDFKMVVAKFTADGALDASFGAGGFAIKNVATGANGELARGIVVQPSGKIVISGTVEKSGGDPRDRDVALVRFNPNGSLDTSFGSGGVVTLDLSTGEVVGTGYVADSAWGLTGYDDGRLLVSAAQKRSGGTDTDFAVVRLSADGVRDSSFGTMGVAALDINNRSASPRTTTLLPDGSIVAAGYMNDGTVTRPVLFKLSSSGQLVPGFATGGIFSTNVLTASTEAYGAALQGTSLVTTGYGRNDASESLDWVSLRITAAGVLDPSYGTGGFTRIDVAGFSDNSRALVALPDSRLLLVGGGRPTETNADAMVAILTENGARDTRFSPTGYKLYDLGGAADFFWGAAVSPDKSRVAIVGIRGGAASDPGNDDGAVLVLPLGK